MSFPSRDVHTDTAPPLSVIAHEYDASHHADGVKSITSCSPSTRELVAAGAAGAAAFDPPRQKRADIGVSGI